MKRLARAVRAIALVTAAVLGFTIVGAFWLYLAAPGP